jgi:hypothetical protein
MQASATNVLMAHPVKFLVAIIIAALTTSKAISETVVFSCEFVGPSGNQFQHGGANPGVLREGSANL